MTLWGNVLHPFVIVGDLGRITQNGIFKKSGRSLWLLVPSSLTLHPHHLSSLCTAYFHISPLLFLLTVSPLPKAGGIHEEYLSMLEVSQGKEAIFENFFLLL